MARARAVETRLERQLPAVDEFYTSGFLTKTELLELTRTRTHWEYRLVAKPLLLLDIQNAVKYELALEERLRQYCQRTKVNLKHRWSILERIEYIYSIGIKHLKGKDDRETARKEFVLFLKSFNRIGTLSKVYGQLMVAFPTRSDIWVEAALWEGLERRNIDHGRAIVQQALVTMSGDPSVWAVALKLELAFADRLLDGVLEEHEAERRKAGKQHGQQGHGSQGGAKDKAETPLSQTLTSENEAMADLVLGLALAKAVVEEALESPASGPELLKRLLAVCGEYGFTKEVAVAAVDGTMRKMYDVLVRHQSVASSAPKAATVGGSTASRKRPLQQSEGPSQQERARWREGGLASVLCSYLLVEALCASEGKVLLRTAAAYLDEAASAPAADGLADRRRRRATTQELQDAATTSLAALLTVAALPPATREALSAGQSSRVLWQTVVLPAAARVFAALAAVAPPAAVSRVCLSLLGMPPNALKEETVRSCIAAVASAEVGKKGGKQAGKKEELDAACVKPAEARVRELVRVAQDGQGNTQKQAKKPDQGDGEGDDEGDGRWPVSVLGQFLSLDDRKTLFAAHGRSADASLAAAPVTGDDVDELLLWWRAEEKRAGDSGGKAGSHGGDAPAAVRARLRRAAFDFLSRFGLVASTAAAEGGPAQGNTKAGSAKKKSSAPATPAASQGDLSTNEFSHQHPLLLSSHGISFTDPKRTPLCLWRVFNALEVTEGRYLFPPTPTAATAAPSASSDSDDDSEGHGDASRRKPPPHFDSYAEAGAHFLATAPHGLLDRQGQLDRTVGLCALVRSRLYSLTGVRASPDLATTRTDLLHWLTTTTSFGDAHARIDSMSRFLDSVERRCQPLPRQCQVSVAIPFLEAVAAYFGSHGQATAQEAVKRARLAHERLLDLYGFTKHVADFLPVLYHHSSSNTATAAAARNAGDAAPSSSLQPRHTDFKASQPLVAAFNVEDWIAYALFERNIAKDLHRSRAVTERARRACLAPQQLLVKLSNAGA